MNRLIAIAAGVVVLFAIGVVLSCVYTIYPTDQVLLTEFGAPRAVITEPGLHFKIPFMQFANFMPRQLLNLEAPSEEVIAADKKRLVVDAFARWRIVDPLRFYQSVPNANQDLASTLLAPMLSSSVRAVLGSQNFAAMLSQKRDQLMRDIRDGMNQEARGFGIVVVDVRIRRADLPQANSLAIYQRMQKEREREASEYRAEGDETAQRVRARAEREVTVLVAEATRESEILRGQGDAEKTRILGEAFGQDPDFFAFWRSMQAYQDAFKGANTTLILSPNSEFFRYFGSAGGGSAGTGPRKKR
ncbi:MAG: protease modulator HflC [Alphaproteobacteria bacterium]|nr:protease modulator HflC [Alphaproteobacteria bacterium]MBV9692842.1 protease modulator HflC [Alphaproteobacteria bacterium]